MPEAGSPASAVAATPLLRVAHVRRVHGVRGEVRAQTLGGDLGRFAPGTALLAERDGRRLTVASSRPLDGDDILLAFTELPSREEAATLSGDYLCVGRAQARALGDDEWFVWQLVGLRVVSNDGEELGVVRDVEEQPASDVIVVGAGTDERRYPLVREWVESVDVAAGVVVVTPWHEDLD
ncbi:MAG: 16S rRNA processing protein RimM [Candidatus Dormibacteraeota bacterium]|uniref:Ribosome maturation factor RimM n=1 Tax=Candidatus Aeolococcus gillhamiae TaxID=3127015 RepID=A0A2W5ZE14_9BACT|nr:16S rRNA processing protein RimM [Candidatus Dormibacteraeota bacterium]PZR81205.1 MAG: 16S rRNA processing protein RimM [Candidatus Dormibacter sp. RRmetagenome_bin12]